MALDVEIQELIEADIDSHCDTFFAEAFIGKGKTSISALEYYEQINNDLPEDLEQLTCAKDVWLFSVLNFHSSMLPEDSKGFTVEPIGSYTYLAKGSNIGYGNLHLEDVSIARKL